VYQYMEIMLLTLKVEGQFGGACGLLDELRHLIDLFRTPLNGMGGKVSYFGASAVGSWL